MLSREQKIEKIRILEEKQRRFKLNAFKRTFDSLYPWQRKFNAATKTYRSSMLMAANRVGKTLTGTTIDAAHLTGDYPDGWEGHEFKKSPLCWLLGYSGEKTRDLLQTPLFGRFLEGKFEGGLIPADRIIDWRAMTGTSGAMR